MSAVEVQRRFAFGISLAKTTSSITFRSSLDLPKTCLTYVIQEWMQKATVSALPVQNSHQTVHGYTSRGRHHTCQEEEAHETKDYKNQNIVVQFTRNNSYNVSNYKKKKKKKLLPKDCERLEQHGWFHSHCWIDQGIQRYPHNSWPLRKIDKRKRKKQIRRRQSLKLKGKSVVR